MTPVVPESTVNENVPSCEEVVVKLAPSHVFAVDSIQILAL